MLAANGIRRTWRAIWSSKVGALRSYSVPRRYASNRQLGCCVNIGLISRWSCELFSELYLAPPQAYVQLLNDDGLPPQVMVLGHNPGLESLVYMLSGEYEAFPTAAVATFEFRSSWSEFASSLSCDFLGLARPKEM